VLPSSLAARLFAAMLIAALIVSVLVVRARTPDLMLEVTKRTARFDPDDDGRRDVAVVRYFVREDDPGATVQIVGPDLEIVRTFIDQGPLAANRPMRLIWDGRTDTGERAPPGRYRLRVILPSVDRDMVFPRRIDLRR
jgi:hypothetical protein